SIGVADAPSVALPLHEPVHRRCDRGPVAANPQPGREAVMARWTRTVIAMVGLALMASGCASSPASLKPGAATAKAPDLREYQALAVQVARGDGVQASDSELERIAGRIVEAVRKKRPDRFTELRVASAADAAAPTIGVAVQLTRYDKGSAFARFMLAGLGQIHVDAKVTLRDQARDAVLGEYEVTKTFAWGGFYGGSTSIEDVEVGFADG